MLLTAIDPLPLYGSMTWLCQDIHDGAASLASVLRPLATSPLTGRKRGIFALNLDYLVVSSDSDEHIDSKTQARKGLAAVKSLLLHQRQAAPLKQALKLQLHSPTALN